MEGTKKGRGRRLPGALRACLLGSALALAACAGDGNGGGTAPRPLASGTRLGTLAVLPLAGASVTLVKYGVVSFSNEEVVRPAPDWRLDEAFRRAVEAALAGGPTRAVPLAPPPGASRPAGAAEARPLLEAALAASPADAVLVVEEDAAEPAGALPGPSLHGCGLFYRVGLLSPSAMPFCRFRLVVLDGRTLQPIGSIAVRDSAERQELRPAAAADRGYGASFAATQEAERLDLLRQDIEAIIARSVPRAMAELGLVPKAP